MPEVKQILEIANAPMLNKIRDNIFLLEDIAEKLINSITDNPPITVKDGGYIRDGYDKELDELRNAEVMGKQWLANLESQEKESTGIKNLKVGYKNA